MNVMLVRDVCDVIVIRHDSNATARLDDVMVANHAYFYVTI